MPQPMQNLEDSSDLTTAMNKALALLATAFKVNTIPTNNNQRSSLIPRNSQIAQQDINASQDIKMQMVDDNVGNQVIQCRGEAVQFMPATASKARKRDVAYLQQQLQIAQEEEARIQSTQEECEFMAAADAYEETKKAYANCTLENNLQQASTSGTQSDKAPVYDSGSAENASNVISVVSSGGQSGESRTTSEILRKTSAYFESFIY
ncbi:hypothetical protein Tco_0981440 [Tanacetum coccineum]